MSDSSDIIKCQNIIASSHGITETEHGAQLQFVKKEEIKSITLKYGCAAHRPMAELVLGSALSILGIFGLYEILRTVGASRYYIGLVALGGIGGYIIYDVVRKYHYLHIVTSSQIYKIRFAHRTALGEISAFCKQISERWNYEILKTE